MQKGHNYGLCRKCGKDHGLPPMLGFHHSDEARIKMSLPNKGRHPSKETRKKMSDARKGEKCYIYGKHHSKETKAKIGAKARERMANPEARENLRKKTTALWANGFYEGRIYSGIFVNPSTIEIMLREFLDDHSIPYSIKKVINLGYKFRSPDVFIEPNIIIEADGRYHHSENCHGKNLKAEDKKADKVMKKMGYIIYRIPEPDFRNGKYLETLNVILTTHHLNQKS